MHTVWPTRHTTLILLTCIIPAPTFAAAQHLLRPGRLPREVRQALRPGVMATFESSTGTARDIRHDRLLALHVPADRPPTPFLPADPFKVTMETYVRLRLKGEYRFSAEGRGTLRLSLNDKPVFAHKGDLAEQAPISVALIRGYNTLRLDYESPGSGDATFRLYWQSDEIPREPIPTTQIHCNSASPALKAGLERRRGRELVAAHGCLKCHASDVDPGPAEHAMPELARTAPRLDDAGSRLSAPWMAEWILAPRSVRNQVTMPAVFAGLDDRTAARHASDIAAYLSTRRDTRATATTEARDGDVDRGRTMYEGLGCIGCHLTAAPGSDEANEDEFGRTTLNHVGAKFRPGALANFLRQPHAGYAWSRMPDFQLTGQEASALAAFLRSVTASRPEPRVDVSRGDPMRGAKLFAESGCAHCHVNVIKDKPPAVAPPLAKLNHAKGCLAEVDAARGPAPKFDFDERQRQALRTFLSTDLASLGRAVPAEASRRMVTALSCLACHRRDDAMSRLPLILEDESELGWPPEMLPTLSWTGEKLNADWVERLIAGRLGYRSRAWLRARMPLFPPWAPWLAAGISAEHGFAPGSARLAQPDAHMAAVGKRLVEKDGGFNCVQCHAIGDREPTGAFEERGLDFVRVKERVRYTYYRRWLLEPRRLDPSTRMPTLSPDGRTTTLTTEFGGDAQKQFDAIWQFILSLEVPP